MANGVAFQCSCSTTEPVFKDHPIGPQNMVFQDSWSLVKGSGTVEPVLRDHCHERPPVLTDHTFFAERPTFQYN